MKKSKKMGRPAGSKNGTAAVSNIPEYIGRILKCPHCQGSIHIYY